MMNDFVCPECGARFSVAEVKALVIGTDWKMDGAYCPNCDLDILVQENPGFQAANLPGDGFTRAEFDRLGLVSDERTPEEMEAACPNAEW